MACTQEAYRTASTSRELVRHVASYTPGHPEPCVTMCAGMDNRDLLPPFFPICRNEDGIFGYMLGRCVDETYAGHLPWAIEHSPVGQRTCNAEAASGIRRFKGSPSYWAADIQGHIDATCRLAVDPDFPLPCDLPTRSDSPNRLIHQLVSDFGRLLRWWPAIVERSALLSSHGVGLGRRIS